LFDIGDEILYIQLYGITLGFQMLKREELGFGPQKPTEKKDQTSEAVAGRLRDKDPP